MFDWLFALRRSLQFRKANDRILLICLDEIGDNVLRTAMINNLCKSAPATRVDIVVRPLVKNFYEGCPCFENILIQPAYPRARSNYRLLMKEFVWLTGFYFRTGLIRNYNYCIVARSGNDYRWAHWLAFFSGARVRMGAGLTRGFNGNTVKPEKIINFYHVFKQPIHEVICSHYYIESIGFHRAETISLNLWVKHNEKGEAQSHLKSLTHDKNTKYIGFVLGAGHPRRKWPHSNYIDIGHRVINDGYVILLLGGRDEQPEANLIDQELGEHCHNLTARLSLRQNAAILESCRCVFGNDTGLTHMAAACYIPVIAVTSHASGSSQSHHLSPSRFGPWGSNSRVLQPTAQMKPCKETCQANEAHCICEIHPDEVYKAFLEFEEIKVTAE